MEILKMAILRDRAAELSSRMISGCRTAFKIFFNWPQVKRIEFLPTFLKQLLFVFTHWQRQEKIIYSLMREQSKDKNISTALRLLP